MGLRVSRKEADKLQRALEMPDASEQMAMKILPTLKPKVHREASARKAKTMAKAEFTLSMTLPIEVLSQQNLKSQWTARFRFAKDQRKNLDSWMWGMSLSASGSAFPGRWRVTLVRLGCPQAMDQDNLAVAFKAIRDGIAFWLGVDDQESKDLAWYYGQESDGGVGIRIVIERLPKEKSDE